MGPRRPSSKSGCDAGAATCAEGCRRGGRSQPMVLGWLKAARARGVAKWPMEWLLRQATISALSAPLSRVKGKAQTWRPASRIPKLLAAQRQEDRVLNFQQKR